MSQANLIFPSGRTVRKIKKDAKEFKGIEKCSTTEALNQLAVINGVEMPWDKAISELEKYSDVWYVHSLFCIGLDTLISVRHKQHNDKVSAQAACDKFNGSIELNDDCDLILNDGIDDFEITNVHGVSLWEAKGEVTASDCPTGSVFHLPLSKIKKLLILASDVTYLRSTAVYSFQGISLDSFYMTKNDAFRFCPKTLELSYGKGAQCHHEFGLSPKFMEVSEFIDSESDFHSSLGSDKVAELVSIDTIRENTLHSSDTSNGDSYVVISRYKDDEQSKNTYPLIKYFNADYQVKKRSIDSYISWHQKEDELKSILSSIDWALLCKGSLESMLLSHKRTGSDLLFKSFNISECYKDFYDSVKDLLVDKECIQKHLKLTFARVEKFKNGTYVSANFYFSISKESLCLDFKFNINFDVSNNQLMWLIEKNNFCYLEITNNSMQKDDDAMHECKFDLSIKEFTTLVTHHKKIGPDISRFIKEMAGKPRFIDFKGVNPISEVLSNTPITLGVQHVNVGHFCDCLDTGFPDFIEKDAKALLNSFSRLSIFSDIDSSREDVFSACRKVYEGKSLYANNGTSLILLAEQIGKHKVVFDLKQFTQNIVDAYGENKSKFEEYAVRFFHPETLYLIDWNEIDNSRLQSTFIENLQSITLEQETA